MQIEISKDEATKDGYLMPYGVRVEQSKPYDVLTLKNLTLAALLECIQHHHQRCSRVACDSQHPD